MDSLRFFEKEQTKDIDRPHLQAGDIVRVEMKITEGEKSRLQTFEGTILGVRGSGPSATFTVRRETSGFGVERIFPLYSPLISEIEILKRQKVRRARLNYLREAGRRRFKEDVVAMQRHVKDEARKQKLADEAKVKAEAETEAKKEEENKVKEAEEVKADSEVEAKKDDSSTEESKKDKTGDKEG